MVRNLLNRPVEVDVDQQQLETKQPPSLPDIVQSNISQSQPSNDQFNNQTNDQSDNQSNNQFNNQSDNVLNPEPMVSNYFSSTENSLDLPNLSISQNMFHTSNDINELFHHPKWCYTPVQCIFHLNSIENMVLAVNVYAKYALYIHDLLRTYDRHFTYYLNSQQIHEISQKQSALLNTMEFYKNKNHSIFNDLRSMCYKLQSIMPATYSSMFAIYNIHFKNHKCYSICYVSDNL